jgi:bifunctional DNase/RNase
VHVDAAFRCAGLGHVCAGLRLQEASRFAGAAAGLQPGTSRDHVLPCLMRAYCLGSLGARLRLRRSVSALTGCRCQKGGAKMLERFTDRARIVVVLAQEEARMLNHSYVGTEHILLGLIQQGEGIAVRALESLGISLGAVRQQVEEIVGRGDHAPSGPISFTPRAKKVLELSLRESLQLGDNYLGTEHILLGLIRHGVGVAAQVLVKLGADLNRVRQQVIQLLHGYEGMEPTGAPPALPERKKLPQEPAGAAATRTERGKRPTAARVKAISWRLSAARQRVVTRLSTGELDQRPPGTVQVTLVGVRVEQATGQPIVLLREVSGNRYLPIWTGPVEATAIVFAQEGRKTAQPLAHDLLCDVLKTMGAQLLNVTISTLIEGIFHSHLSLSNHRTVSSRPSDAVALAIWTGAPILVGTEVLDTAGVSIADGELKDWRNRSHERP